MAQDSSDNNNFNSFDNYEDNLAQPSTSTGNFIYWFLH